MSSCCVCASFFCAPHRCYENLRSPAGNVARALLPPPRLHLGPCGGWGGLLSTKAAAHIASPSSLPSLFLPSLPHPCWLTGSEVLPVYSLSSARESLGGIFRLRRGPALLAPPLMGLFPGSPGSLNSPPRARRCGQLSSYLSGPQGTSCPASPNLRGHDDGCACALRLPLAKQNPAWLGQGRL